jgi:hypothetical protein
VKYSYPLGIYNNIITVMIGEESKFTESKGKTEFNKIIYSLKSQADE